MDTPAAIARDLIADVGRVDALRYLAKLLPSATGPRRFAVLRLMLAVLA